MQITLTLSDTITHEKLGQIVKHIEETFKKEKI